MRSLQRWPRKGSPVAALRCGASTNDTALRLKKTLYAEEQKRAEVARARRRWIREQGMLDPTRLVFIDETCTSTAMVRLRGRSPRGKRLVGYAPHGHRKTITFVTGVATPRGGRRFWSVLRCGGGGCLFCFH